MSFAELEASEKFHNLNLFHGSMSMLFNLNDTNATLDKTPQSSSKAGKKTPPKSPKEPKAGKKPKGKNPKPKSPKTPPTVLKTFVL
jgi:hypothetical protein